jgi:hypothetical protein
MSEKILPMPVIQPDIAVFPGANAPAWKSEIQTAARFLCVRGLVEPEARSRRAMRM